MNVNRKRKNLYDSWKVLRHIDFLVLIYSFYRFLEVRRQAILFMTNHELLSPLLKRISAVLGCDDDGVTVICKVNDAAAA